MATVESAQIAQDNNAQARNYPIDVHGKMRVCYFYYKNLTGGTLADGTEIDLCDLPPGRVRILPNLSRYRATAMSTSRTLDIGHRAYYKNDVPDSVVEDDDAFVADKDISSAVVDTAFDSAAGNMKADLYSKSGVRLFATVDGGTIPADGIVEGYVVYVYE